MKVIKYKDLTRLYFLVEDVFSAIEKTKLRKDNRARIDELVSKFRREIQRLNLIKTSKKRYHLSKWILKGMSFLR